MHSPLLGHSRSSTGDLEPVVNRSFYLARLVKHPGILAFRMECPAIHSDIFGVGEHAKEKERNEGK